MTRERLPDCQPNETFDLEFDGTGYAVTIGFFPDGRPGEVFTHGAKVRDSHSVVKLLAGIQDSDSANPHL